MVRKFKKEEKLHSLSPKELRDCYLQFIEFDLPASIIYDYWVKKYGTDKRCYLLAFIMTALVADIKSNEPGVHYDEFGPLGTSLLKIRTLQTLDQKLINDFFTLKVFSLKKGQRTILEDQIVRLYLSGILNYDFNKTLNDFSSCYLSGALIRQKATVMQCLKNIYYLTPDTMFLGEMVRENILNMMDDIITKLYQKEQTTEIFKEYYS